MQKNIAHVQKKEENGEMWSCKKEFQ
jgi:hypothetical protein